MAKKTSTTKSPAAKTANAEIIAKPAKKTTAKTHRRIPSAEPDVPTFTITNDDIATLAFSYWESRGCQGGSQEEDWARAERELRSLLAS